MLNALAARAVPPTAVIPADSRQGPAGGRWGVKFKSMKAEMASADAGSAMQRLLYAAAAAAFCALAAAVLFYRLGDFPLEDWDEAIYAEVSRDLAEGGDFLALKYNHTPYFNKPPLYFWIAQAGIRLFGFSEFSARLPGAVFGALTLWAVAAFGTELRGRWAGLAAAGLLISSAMFLENGSRHAGPDSLLLFLSAAALLAQWRGRRSPAARYAQAALLGLAFMTKSAAALPLVLTLVILHFALGCWRQWTPAQYAWATGIAAAIVLPWYAAETAIHGPAFWQKHFYWNVWLRAVQPGAIAPTHVHGPFFYVFFLASQLKYMWPVAIPPGLWALQRALHGASEPTAPQPACSAIEIRSAAATLIVAAAVPVAIFSAMGNKVWWYVLPALPPLCLLGGVALDAALCALRPLRLRLAAAALTVLLLGAGADRNIGFTLKEQVQRGIREYGAIAELSRAAEPAAARLGLRDPIVFVPAESPTVAAYTRLRVAATPRYPELLSAAGGRVPDCDGVMVLDRTRAIETLKGKLAIEILAARAGHVLARVRETPAPAAEPLGAPGRE